MQRIDNNDTATVYHSHPNQLSSLHHELEELHARVMTTIPMLNRIAVVAYDQKNDLLKTFAESTQSLEIFSHHEFPLKECYALKKCADSAEPRITDDIPKEYAPDSVHSNWLIEHGYHSSFTVPVYHLQQFIGFIFFNSKQKGLFTTEIQQELMPFCDLISFVVNAEYSLLHAIVASAELTKELSPGYRNESKQHMERIGSYAKVIAREVANFYQLDDEMIETIHLFSRLHDIGKSALPTDILLKPDSLAGSERDKMRNHIADGIALVDNIIENLGSPVHPCVDTLKSIIACHQEFLDGSGYPNGIEHEDIPISARIVTVANIFDALTSHRPYKQACSVSAAMLELEKMVASGKLDGKCVSALRNHQSYLTEIIKQHPESDPSEQH